MTGGEHRTDGPVVTDHAVLRYLQRVYRVDVELIRREIEAATARGRQAAAIEGHTRFKIAIEDLRFAVEDGFVVTTIRLNRRRGRR